MGHLNTEIKYKREIKSYKLRSRMTPTQREGLNYWSDYGIEKGLATVDFAQLFCRNSPIILEIGFGMGASLLHLARVNPEINFIGIEVHKPGIGALLRSIKEEALTNIRIFWDDANKVLLNSIPNESLYGVLLFFPDPWPKRRHQKRRIVQSPFINLVHQKLLPQGYFHLATDISDYALHMKQIMNTHPSFAIMNEPNGIPESLARPRTKFAERGEVLGNTITELMYLKIK